MTSPRRFLPLLLCVLALASGLGPRAATQVPQTPVAAVGTGLIAGRVLDQANKPIPEALVMLQGGRGPQPAAGGRGGGFPFVQVLTDSQGRFAFGGLVPGTYNVIASKAGYIRSVTGALPTVELSDAARIVDLVQRLSKVATISGTIRDEAGDPVVGASVRVFRRGVQGSRTTGWTLVFSGIPSDDRGAYRIASVPAGEYIVCACPSGPIPFDQGLLNTLATQPMQLMSLAARALASGSDVVSLDNTLRMAAPTFYPNSSTATRAERIAVAAGEDRTGVDIRVALVRAARVSGTVVGAQSAITAAELRLVPADESDPGADLFGIPPMLVQPDGRFDFASVPPGQYRLTVLHRETAQRGGFPSGAAMSFLGPRGAPPPLIGVTSGGGPALLAEEPPLWANEPITVGENAVTGLVVTLRQATRVSGRLQFAGSAPHPLERTIALAIVRMADMNANVMQQSRATADGSFAIPGVVPGRHVLAVVSPPAPYTNVKTITVGGVDVTDLPIEIGEKTVADMVVTLTDVARASLAIATSAPTPPLLASDGLVLLFPADRKYWSAPTAALARFRTMQLTSAGATTAPDLPAGDYFVTFVNALDGEWQITSRLEELSRRAQRVTVLDGEKKTVEVRR